MAAKTIHFDIFKSATNGQWYWHLRARNGQIIATSGESYKRAAHAISGIGKLVRDLRRLDEVPLEVGAPT